MNYPGVTRCSRCKVHITKCRCAVPIQRTDLQTLDVCHDIAGVVDSLENTIDALRGGGITLNDAATGLRVEALHLKKIMDECLRAAS